MCFVGLFCEEIVTKRASGTGKWGTRRGKKTGTGPAAPYSRNRHKKRSGKTENLPSRTSPRALCMAVSLLYGVLYHRKVVCSIGEKQQDAYSENDHGNMHMVLPRTAEGSERDSRLSAPGKADALSFVPSRRSDDYFSSASSMTARIWATATSAITATRIMGASLWHQRGTLGDTSVFGAGCIFFTFFCARWPWRLLPLRLFKDFENLDGSAKSNHCDAYHARLLVASAGNVG